MPKTKILLAMLMSGLMLCNICYADEVVYLKSTEPCRVEAYPAPGMEALSEKLKCGEKAELLETRGDYARIQLAGDKIIWINVANASKELPAEVKVQQLLEYQKKIEGEIDRLNKQVERLSESSTKLINALIATEAEKKNK